MYQLPVGNIDRIRKARKAVKSILSEIGLEDCQGLLKELNENSENNSDEEEEAFQDTEWYDFTDGFNGRMQKKWPYRSRSLCCNLCKYSSQNIYNFRGHVSRCHGYVQTYCALASCTQCLFIGHPKTVKKHMLFFHAKPNSHMQQPREVAGAATVHRGNERYHCRRCGYPASSIFVMKKHIILKHLDNVAEQYIGYRLQMHGHSTVKIYCCKVCKVNSGSLDQLLHHLLIEPAHFSVGTQVQSLIYENKGYTIKSTPNGNGMFVTFPSIAPKPQQAPLFNSNSLVLPSNGQPPGTVVAVQQLQGATNNATLICAPGTNQAFLPPQASALVQLASAEAKGLLQPGATIALRSALPQGTSMVQLPTVSNVSLKQAPVTLTSQPQPSHPQAQQIVFPSGVQASVTSGHATVPKPPLVSHNTAATQSTLKGTMLTSQSLLNHLIPTGNSVNGMPTYTFAPLQVAMPQSTNTLPKTVEQSNASPQAKKWITCPLCNELFPSNVFEMHTEVAHKTKSSTPKSVAARAVFLKKMPDKTVKCLTCKILLSEKSVFQHLLHGLNCLYCSEQFFSIRQLLEHVKQHNPASKAYCDFLRQKYRVYTKGGGVILFPYFDVHTTAPKEILGDTEVNLALVTNSLDLIFFKLQPSNQPEICPAPAKINSSYCPFCNEKFHHEPDHIQHLKQKHFVAPTIHAILKTEAFKCIYCNGVYTGKVTQQAVMLHIQRCRCSPKHLQPQPQPPPPPRPTAVLQQQQPQPQPQQQQQQQQQLLQKSAQPLSQASGLYLLQMPQGMAVKQTLAPTRVVSAAPKPQRQESEAELLSKKRLEAAWREVMETNKREREQKAAMRRRQVHEKLLPPPEPEPEVQSDPAVKLALEPSLVERRCSDEGKLFISKYFNVNPYASKAETDELCKRLSLTKAEVAALFSKKRSKCLKTVKKNTAAILLGFNMTELSKVKHNLLTPVLEPAVTPESPSESPGDDAPEKGDAKDGAEPMDESGNDKAPDVEPMEVESQTGK
ncbi:activity-dependent neuroprotector homeobox protein 2b [Salarias fasciatus]|uniref:Activity-dependent neuroprotector homeobox protein 2-like n=1 Tax=Salarias fasciatus TaxID=181472 RepID=A0A672F7H4_SALFA|nr:activity-dependent neuroprotector homeobox protein 2-like [Salarias fasciatus]